MGIYYHLIFSPIDQRGSKTNQWNKIIYILFQIKKY